MEIKKFIEALGERRNEFLISCRECKSATELLTMAEKENIALDEAGAAELFNAINNKAVALSDEELENVAGGSAQFTYSYQLDFYCKKLSDAAEFEKHVRAKHQRVPNTCPHWVYAENGSYVHQCYVCKNFAVLY